VVAVSRSAARAKGVLGDSAKVVEGNPRFEGEWMKAIDGCDAVVNLAGEPVVGQRWNDQVKSEIVASRVDTTRNVAVGIESAAHPPRVFVSSSAVGFYGPLEFSEEADEEHVPGNDFLAQVCVKWEAASSLGTAKERVRKAVLRIAVVLDSQDGALAKMLPLFRLGVGGPVGTGSQPFPWIHIDDLVRMILWIFDEERAEGVLNAAAPGGVTNKAFARALGRVLRRPAFLPTPALVLRLMFGDGAQIILTGQRAAPKRAQELGYQFQFPTLKEALEDLLG
jgi:hypothetical protein